MFNLKKPCRDCPFRKDGHMLVSLEEGRIEEILNNIIHEDGFFSCHKTIDYSKNPTELQKQNQFCAGALIAIAKAGATYKNRNTRLAVSWGMYSPDDLEDVKRVIDPEDFCLNLEAKM